MSDAMTLLREARGVIADPARWTRASYARDAGGHPVAATDPAAVCWCAAGALQLVTGRARGGRESAWRAYWALSQACGGGENVMQVNDRGGHASVLAAYDAAIAVASGQSDPQGGFPCPRP